MAQAPSTPGTPQPAGDADPSMDDILASIRRILSDEEKSAKPPPGDVLMLDPSMMVDAPEMPAPEAARVETAREDQAMDEHGSTAEHAQATAPASRPVTSELPAQPAAPASELAPDSPPYRSPSPQAEDPAAPLVAPEAAAAAAVSVGALMRTLAQERNAAVNRGGPTIEDIVREQIRPLLKAWLDAHLPGLVERLVKAEIERVVGRITG